MLVDKFDRQAKDLRISVTDRCNYRCVYCMPSHVEWLPRPQILSFEEIETLARLFVKLGVDGIRLTGGEPLVRRDLPLLASRLSKIEGLQDLSLTTNGYYLPQLARDLYEAGVRRINISLDTLDPKKFRDITGNDSFDRVIQGIEAARSTGFAPIKINCVAIRGFNDDEIVDFLRWGKEKNLEIRFIEFMPLDGDHKWSRDRVLTQEEILEKAREFGSTESVEVAEAAPAAKFRSTDNESGFGIIPSVTQPFCRSCTRIRLTADGKFRTCLFAISEVDLRGPLRSGASSDELARLIQAAVSEKWAGHKINDPDFVQPPRAMYAIGG
ncbi:GTP 3',8-cyclase MoaA [bacterium]|nr:GTP 3',8-cyclase MoaA [bacterium]